MAPLAGSVPVWLDQATCGRDACVGILVWEAVSSRLVDVFSGGVADQEQPYYAVTDAAGAGLVCAGFAAVPV